MKYDLYLTGTVGWDIEPEYVRNQLARMPEQDVHVFLSSLGGSLVDGLAIYQLFKAHGRVVVHLAGFNASAATVLAMGAREVVMSQFGLFLVHGCSQLVDGWTYMNAEEIEAHIATATAQKEAADTMDRLMASIYAHRATAQPDQMLATMKEARWLTAHEVLDLGLIDTIDPEEGDRHDTQMTAALSARFIAKGYPLPTATLPPEATTQPQQMPHNMNTPTPTPTDHKSLLARLATALGIDTNSPDTPTAPPTPQEKEQDGGNPEAKDHQEPTAQAAEIESLKAQLATQAAEIDSLRAQLATQAAADGDQSETQATEAPTTQAQDDSPEAQARAAYDRMKTIL